jgi:hypothetical protein
LPRRRICTAARIDHFANAYIVAGHVPDPDLSVWLGAGDSPGRGEVADGLDVPVREVQLDSARL